MCLASIRDVGIKWSTMKEVKDFFNKIHQIDETILDTYISQWMEYDVPKKTIMTTTAPGETERYKKLGLLSGERKMSL